MKFPITISIATNAAQVQGDKKAPTEQDILLKEYESVVEQFVHWDSLFWTKGQVFLAIESAFSVLILQPSATAFLQTLSKKPGTQILDAPTVVALILFWAAGVFNIYLCYVWFRTNCRNLAYRQHRIDRAKELEKRIGILQTFSSVQNWPRGSAVWEKICQ